jgi:uncharacterized DUF497 family protein
MAVSFDSAKSKKNLRERGISFELAAGFEWVSVLKVEDLTGTTVNADFRRWV